MKLEIENVSVMYPDEDSGEERTMVIEVDDEFVHLNFIDPHDKPTGMLTLDRTKSLILRDALNMILKNKLIK